MVNYGILSDPSCKQKRMERNVMTMTKSSKNNVTYEYKDTDIILHGNLMDLSFSYSHLAMRVLNMQCRLSRILSGPCLCENKDPVNAQLISAFVFTSWI